MSDPLPNEIKVQEEDITDIIIGTDQQNSNISREPPPPQNQEDSESEEDVTEELSNMEQLTISNNNNIINLQPSSSETTTSNSVPYRTTRIRSTSNANPTTTSSTLLPRRQRVWEMDRQAPKCRRCHRRFNFLVRRHHCRRCGQIVCDKCSTNRIRLPVEELIEDPIISPAQYPVIALQSQRVCDTCYREPIRRHSSESHQRRDGRSIQVSRSDSSQSLMIDCPVCGQSFLGLQKMDQETHLKDCLNIGSPPVHTPRYIVYELSADSAQIGDECPICFEEFEKGDKVSRMICLCSYHQHCLADWLQKGKGCPVHFDSIQ